MKTSTGKEGETKSLVKKDFSNKDTNTEEIQIDENEYKSLKEKAEFYDEIQKKCEELEKEIGELQIKYAISEAEMKKIDEEVRFDLENKKDKKPAADEETKVKDSKTRDQSKKTNSKSSSSKMEIVDGDFVQEKDNKTIPEDWKILKRKSDKKRVFKSPTGFTFNSRVEALEYMIKQNHAERNQTLMRQHLADEGWYKDKSCPTGWRLRKIQDKRDYEYLSPAMSIVPSMVEMMEHLQSQVPVNSQEITNLQNKMDSLKPKDVKPASQSATTEKPEEILPPGWSRKRVGDTSVFVSPEGEEVPTIQQLLTMESRKSKRKVEQSLEDHFQVCMLPDEKKLAELSVRYGKSVSDLKNWFLKRANEESKKRLKTSASEPKKEKNNPSKPKSSKKKMVKIFKELTNEQNIVLQDVLKANPSPAAEMISELSSKHHIEEKLLIKWFSLKKQQRAASQ